MSYQTVQRPSWLNVLNTGETSVLEPTAEQQHLFDEFECFEIYKTYNGQEIEILIRVHKSIWNGRFRSKCSLHLTWVGGGFVTGGADFDAWRPCHFKDLFDEKSIILCPRYPLMPQSGAQLFAYANAVLLWITNVDCEVEIRKRCLRYRAYIQPGYLDIVSGESAGGHLAAYSWLSLKNAIIGVLYLRYPMLCSYQRDPEQDYMGRKQSREETRSNIMSVLTEILTKGQMAPRIGAKPPEGMGAAYLFSSTRIRAAINGASPVLISTWQLFFRQPDILDCLRAMEGDYSLENSESFPLIEPIVIDVQQLVATLKDPESMLRSFGLTYLQEANALAYTQAIPTGERPVYAPRIVITHGSEDTNCPIGDSKEFSERIERMYTRACVDLYVVPEKHAFDYTRRDTFMQNITNQVRGLKSRE